MMRQHGFFGATMLPVSQLECTGIIEIFSVPAAASATGPTLGLERLHDAARPQPACKNAMWLIARLCRCVSRSRKSPM